MKSLLFATILALGATSFANSASAGDRHNRGSSRHGNYSRGHSQHRGHASGRSGYNYGYFTKYGHDRCNSGYYGPGLTLRVGPVVIQTGSSRGHRRY